MFSDAFSVGKIFSLSAVAFIVAMLWTPLLTNILYRYRLGKQIRDEKSAPIFVSLHKGKAGTPTMGGLLVWVTALVITLLVAWLSRFFDSGFIHRLNFLSRSETLLPLGALVATAIIGLVDDFYNVRKIGPNGGGLRARHRLIIYSVIAVIAAWWFVAKLDWTTIHVPFVGNFDIGWWFAPIIVLVIVATSHSVNIADGLDGLAGGTLLAAFFAYAFIAFAEQRVNLATFCAVIAGGLMAFLWFNIHPARFFMGDTGSMALGTTLGIIAIMTNTIFLLPVIGFLFVLESASVIIQVTSKKIFHRKVFRSAPFHHHLEAIGWPEAKIVMRFWVIAAVMVSLGVTLFLFDRAIG